MVRYYGRARQRTGTVNTNQPGLKQAGCPSTVGKQGKIVRFLGRRVNCNLKTCGGPMSGLRCMYNVRDAIGADKTYADIQNSNNPAIKNYCHQVINQLNGTFCQWPQPKNRQMAGGVGNIWTPRRDNCNQTCNAGWQEKHQMAYPGATVEAYGPVPVTNIAIYMKKKTTTVKVVYVETCCMGQGAPVDGEAGTEAQWKNVFKPLIDAGYNVLILAFISSQTAAQHDKELSSWTLMDALTKVSIKNWLHGQAVALLVSIGGANSPAPVVCSNNPSASQCCYNWIDGNNFGPSNVSHPNMTLGQYCASQNFDGVDFDLESAAPMAASFTGVLSACLMSLSKQVANVRAGFTNQNQSIANGGSNGECIITSAPQVPYFTRTCAPPSTAVQNPDSSCWTLDYVYMEQHYPTAFDFYNIQFYNQEGVCNTQLSLTGPIAIDTNIVGPNATAMILYGIPPWKIVLGKSCPMQQKRSMAFVEGKDGSNYVGGKNLLEWAKAIEWTYNSATATANGTISSGTGIKGVMYWTEVEPSTDPAAKPKEKYPCAYFSSQLGGQGILTEHDGAKAKNWLGDVYPPDPVVEWCIDTSALLPTGLRGVALAPADFADSSPFYSHRGLYIVGGQNPCVCVADSLSQITYCYTPGGGLNSNLVPPFHPSGFTNSGLCNMAAAWDLATGTLYIVGGLYGGGGSCGGSLFVSDKVMSWTIGQSAWVTSTAIMSTPRQGLSAIFYGGQLYAVGGSSSAAVDVTDTGSGTLAPKDSLASWEIYDPVGVQWTLQSARPMSIGRAFLGMTMVGSYMYVMGGYGKAAKQPGAPEPVAGPVQYLEKINLAPTPVGSWVPLWYPPSPNPQWGGGLVTMPMSKLYAVGGSVALPTWRRFTTHGITQNVASNIVDVFDANPGTQQYYSTMRALMQKPRAYCGVAAYPTNHGGTPIIYAVGGGVGQGWVGGGMTKSEEAALTYLDSIEFYSSTALCL